VNRYVTDTHALYWYLINSPRLSATANATFDEADSGRALVYVPAIVIAELFYLNKKLGEPLNFAATFLQLQQSSQFVLLPFEPADVLDFDAHAAVPEMHDRMIVGAALRLGVPCLTHDSQIVNSGLVKTIW
jgi:PIN domain nuclease of toxin-antitoxin system